MENRRLAAIAALSIVELWILGLMVRSVSGGGSHESNFASAATRGPSTGGFERTIATGPAPHVVIDDDDAVLSVSVRSGSTVAVSEHLRTSGWGMHGFRQLSTVEKTADGVAITGPDGTIVVAGSFDRRLDVVVPPGATLEVKNAGSTTVTGLHGDAMLHSDDGTIVVTGGRGLLTASTDNGRIEVSDVIASAVDLSTDDGRISLDRVVADDVSVTSDNGRIDVVRSLLRGGKIKTDDGRITLGLDPQSNVTVSAQASSGSVIAQAPLAATRASSDDDAPSVIRVGSGAGRLDVSSDDGIITVLPGRVE